VEQNVVGRGKVLDRWALCCLSWAHAFDNIVPRSKPPQEYACSVLTSEKLTGKNRDRLASVNPSDLVKIYGKGDKWLALILNGVNFDKHGLVKTIRTEKKKAADKKTDLAAVLRHWEIDQKVSKVEKDMIRDAERALFGFVIMNHPLSDYERKSPLYYAEECRMWNYEHVTGIVRQVRLSGPNAERTKAIDVILEDEIGTLRVALWCNENESGKWPKIEALKKIMIPGNAVNVEGQRRATYMMIKKATKAKKKRKVHHG